MPRHPDPANDALERWGITVIGADEADQAVAETIQRVEAAERGGCFRDYQRVLSEDRPEKPDVVAVNHFRRERDDADFWRARAKVLENEIAQIRRDYFLVPPAALELKGNGRG